MNFIPTVVSIAEIAIAGIILWYVVEQLSAMPANMRRVVQGLIVLVAIMVVLSMFVGQPMHIGIPPAPPPISR
ncbi:MAG: hypothetical protein ABSG76_20275 [Xanthobacteraceae bacterium]|jgi:hypothetical protein